ncbi:hypothetical protein ACIHFC_32365 [Streptomyces sp. NPDC052013]|uniref:hypothetical protein n=1 Tax=Streptomyces sp. NPDC052013 TaxID=3365679 RepID=UPI0037CDAB48
MGTPRKALEERDVHEPRLLHEIALRPHLAQLATSDTVCDAMCSLFLDHPAALAFRRGDLYGELVTRLMTVTAPKDPADRTEATPGPLAQRLLYPAVAHRMLWQDTSALARHEVLDVIAKTLPSLPQTQPCNPEQALTVLLTHGRLLQQDTDADAVAFAHVGLRTYLGVEAIISHGDPTPLTVNAHRDDWTDAVQLTAAGGDERLSTRLLTELVRRADAEPEHRPHLVALAASCLDQLRCRVDPGLVQAVRSRATARY